MRASPHLRRTAARGFTLLELMMVVTIFVMVAMVVLPAVESVAGVKTREEASRLAGTIRAMYGEAVLSGRTCRLVIDLDERSYWPECAEGRVRVKRVEESLRGIRVEEQVKDSLDESEDEERKRIDATGTFAAYEAGLAPKRVLPEGIGLTEVWTQHQEEPYVAGRAMLYFFPHGQTERAYLYVGDGDDTYTVIVTPMSGRTRVVAERVPVPDRETER